MIYLLENAWFKIPHVKCYNNFEQRLKVLVVVDLLNLYAGYGIDYPILV